MGLVVAVGAAEVISAVTILESVAAVGAVLSVVGAVTKNKTLSLIGAGLGVVGGVGALAAGALGAASVAGDVAEAGTFSSPAVDAAAGGAATAGDTSIGAIDATAAGGVGGADAAPDVIGGLSNGLPTPPVPPDVVPVPPDVVPPPAENLSLAATSTNAADAVAPGTTGAPISTAPTGLADPAVAAPATATPPPAVPGGAAFGDGPVTAGGQAITAPGDSSGLSGAFGKIVDYAGAHPVVALGVLQAGGSLLTGLTSTLTPAQVAALNAQAAANDAASALTRQQTANLAMPKSVASSAPVTGTPQTLVPPSGFINQPRPVAVTGVPA